MGEEVVLVVTEHPSYLDERRLEGYERIRQTLETVARRPVEAVHYLDARELDADAIVLSGSKAPWAVHDRGELTRLGEVVTAAASPVLGICAGMQLLATWTGGEVRPAREPERGYAPLEVLAADDLLRGLDRVAIVFQDHEDEITVLPEGFEVLARTKACEVQAVAAPDRRWWGTQFHAERFDAEHPDGERVLRNFFSLAGI